MVLGGPKGQVKSFLGSMWPIGFVVTTTLIR